MRHDLVRTRQVGRHGGPLHFCGRCAAGVVKSLGTQGVKFLHSASLRRLCAKGGGGGCKRGSPYFGGTHSATWALGKSSERVSGTQVHVLKSGWALERAGKRRGTSGLGMDSVVVVVDTGQGALGAVHPPGCDPSIVVHNPSRPPSNHLLPPTTTCPSKLAACGARSSYPSGSMAVTERACERSAQAHCQLQLVDVEPFLLRRVLPRRERGSLLPSRQAVAIVQRRCEPTLLSSQAAAAWMRKGKLRGRDPPIGKVQVVGIFLKRPISAPWENGLVGCRALVRRPRPGPGPPERCTQPRAVEAFWTVP